MEKVEEKRFIKIVYLDSNNAKHDINMELTDLYLNASITYMENIQFVVATISDDGGFAPNEETIIPFHRILAFHALPIQKEENTTKVKPQAKPQAKPQSKSKPNINKNSRRRRPSKKPNIPTNTTKQTTVKTTVKTTVDATVDATVKSDEEKSESAKADTV